MIDAIKIERFGDTLTCLYIENEEATVGDVYDFQHWLEEVYDKVEITIGFGGDDYDVQSAHIMLDIEASIKEDK